MSRKHFIAIAKAIREMHLSTEAKEELAIALGREFRTLNPRFDFSRFRNACLGE